MKHKPRPQKLNKKNVLVDFKIIYATINIKMENIFVVNAEHPAALVGEHEMKSLKSRIIQSISV